MRRFANSLVLNFGSRDIFLPDPVLKSDDDKSEERQCCNNVSVMGRFYLIFVAIPVLLSLYYASAMFFPPKARSRLSFFLWSDGFLTWQEDLDDEVQHGRYAICPKESICSEGALEITLLATSRFTAFASYVAMAVAFSSMMHSTIHALSVTFLGTYIPFAHLSNVHKSMGTLFACLSFAHAIGHFSRWIIRGEMLLVFEQVGISGSIAMLSIIIMVFSVSSWAKNSRWMTFDRRLFAHWFFIFLVFAMFFHHSRCRTITLFFSCLWALDWLYGLVYNTHRLDTVHFTVLSHETGIQMLFRNPEGFEANPGEYIKIMIPWLSKGQKEWHPFSIYTQVGVDEKEELPKTDRSTKTSVHFDPGIDLSKQHHNVDSTLIIKEDHESPSMDGSYQNSLFNNSTMSSEDDTQIDPSNAALILIGMQNEIASAGGLLFDNVKDCIDSSGILNNTSDLADFARSVGVHVFHLPVFNSSIYEMNNDHDYRSAINNFLVTLVSKFFAQEDKYFMPSSWNAEFIDSHVPKRMDSVVTGQSKFDSLDTHHLCTALEKKDIRTIIIGGFLNSSHIVMAQKAADELGLKIIILEDGCVCYGKSKGDEFEENRLSPLGESIPCDEVISLVRIDLTHQRRTPAFQRRPSYSRLLDKGILRLSNYASFLDLKDLDDVSLEDSDAEIGLNDASLSRIIENAIYKLKASNSIVQKPLSVPMDKTGHVYTYDAPTDPHGATNPGSSSLLEVSSKVTSHTTQIFIHPAGDWTKRLYKELSTQAQQSAIWMRGPYVSPYAIATYFSRLVMVASGIGITPALGVLGQYKGFSRFKVLIWFTRSSRMIKFFVPLTIEAHLIIIYYTGSEELNASEIYRLCKHGNIIIQQSRPTNLKNTLSTILATSTNVLYTSDGVVSNSAVDIRQKLSKQIRKKWCIFYCGGSKGLCNDLKKYSRNEIGVNFESEMFDY